ncbi:UNVERIFIED_CONTAM: hypothetical protein K2H54_021639 [Gekko kuhli]
MEGKLTRESGTDFPIPAIPPVLDSETEKLIREKDEEVSAAEATRKTMGEPGFWAQGNSTLILCKAAA